MMLDELREIEEGLRSGEIALDDHETLDLCAAVRAAWAERDEAQRLLWRAAGEKAEADRLYAAVLDVWGDRPPSSDPNECVRLLTAERDGLRERLARAEAVVEVARRRVLRCECCACRSPATWIVHGPVCDAHRGPGTPRAHPQRELVLALAAYDAAKKGGAGDGIEQGRTRHGYDHGQRNRVSTHRQRAR